jgi:hypothetical protein
MKLGIFRSRHRSDNDSFGRKLYRIHDIDIDVGPAQRIDRVLERSIRQRPDT